MSTKKSDSIERTSTAPRLQPAITVVSTVPDRNHKPRFEQLPRARSSPSAGAKKADYRRNTDTTILAFGPYRLLSPQRQLLRDGVEVKIPGRARDVLLALVERAGEVVRKKDLLQRVWPELRGSDATLRVHVAILRRILEAGNDGRRYIESVTRLGYRFITPVMRMSSSPVKLSAEQPGILLRQAQHMIGREEVLSRVLTCIPERHFMTIVGPGGVGKSTLADAALHRLHPTAFSNVCYLDLSVIEPREDIAPRIARALGTTPSINPLSDIKAQIHDQRLLIVLDNCERVIDSAAHMVERLLALAPALHVLTTSREPLRARGEHVLRLAPLEVPADAMQLPLAQALALPAVKLFLQYATRMVETFAVADADIPAVVQICQRLDGLPLAIVLAAGRTDVFGVQALARNLDIRHKLLTCGPRTAVPRHQTLRAMLDWGYEMLPPLEQLALRRLAVFDGCFDVESARGVLATQDIDSHDALEILANLATKSLLNAHTQGSGVRFQLLQTTRAYALEKLYASGEKALV